MTIRSRCPHKGQVCGHRREANAVVEWRQNDKDKESEDDERHDDLLRPFFLMLWSGIHAALEKRPVVQSEIDGEADSRDGKDCDKEPALPVMPRARGQENEGDEYGHPRAPLRDGLFVERIHRCMNGTPAVPPRNARIVQTFSRADGSLYKPKPVRRNRAEC